jgi:hypothetical protein
MAQPQWLGALQPLRFLIHLTHLLGDVLLLLDGVFSMAPKTFLEVYEFIMVPFNRFLMLHLQG